MSDEAEKIADAILEARTGLEKMIAAAKEELRSGSLEGGGTELLMDDPSEIHVALI
jgi:hypothetical protein